MNETLSPKAVREVRENVQDFDENDKAIYTLFEHRFVPDSQIKGTVFETFTNSSDLIDVSFNFSKNDLNALNFSELIFPNLPDILKTITIGF